ncbi:hypothetical protein E2R54_03070 [Microbacterium oleivorans]|uniref:Acyltransferase 3 domain-containing protein n=1 Tax=Microbacterium oleivorans TaxID=273677 RepID=A0A4R5YLG7_9MICO|nr:hypothetical protein E2R54_03070 [Microbacterium oleivorans]
MHRSWGRTVAHAPAYEADATRVARVEWVDAAKAIAIIMVVFLHTVFNHAGSGATGHWGPFVGLLDAFRLPLFFFTAGLFAGKVLRRPLAVLLRERISHLTWIYVIWSMVAVIAVLYLPLTGATDRPPALALLLIPVLPTPATWFIWALIVHFVLAWFAVRVPPAIGLGVATVVSLAFASGLLTTGTLEIDKTLYHLVFFLLAVQISAWVRPAVASTGIWWAVAAVVGFGAGAAVVAKFSLLDIVGVRLVLGLLAVAAGCLVARQISALRGFAWVSALGRNTLPVYLLHWYVLLLVYAVVNTVFPRGAGVFTDVLAPVMTALTIAGCLLVHRLTRAVPGLHARPAWLIRALRPVPPV